MDTWEERVSSYWARVTDADPERALDDMRSLVDERPAGDPDALYEWASVHDFLGGEAEAIPLYREGLAKGLGGDRRPQAVIQLASSLRNVGRADEAVALLREQSGDEVTGDAAQAFLALALRDGGRSDEALRVALTALARHLPLYGRAVENYANALTSNTKHG